MFVPNNSVDWWAVDFTADTMVPPPAAVVDAASVDEELIIDRLEAEK